MRPITLEEIRGAIRCEHTVIGKEATIDRALPIDAATEGSVTFCNKPGARGKEMIKGTAATMVITSYEHEGIGCDLPDKTLILVEDPRLAFARVVDSFFSKKWSPGVHPTAVVSGSARLGKGVHIGPLCTVGEDVEIGDHSRLEGSVFLYDHVRIGQNVVVRAGTVIGTDGFGYNRDPAGRLEKFPHIGGVVIGDDVEIGANVCIARGTMADTKIGRGTKIDNLVHIAHNVQIGEDCLIIAHAQIAGSVHIGDRCWLSPSVTVTNGVSIGNDTMVALGSVVIRDVGPNQYVAGSPARPTIRRQG